MAQDLEQGEGGWLPQLSGTKQFYARLDGVNDPPLNPDYLRYFEQYRTRYFYSDFIQNQGLEDILFALHTHTGTPDSWMDIGGGVVSLFWSLGLNSQKVRAVDVCDISAEALYVLQQFVASDEVPPCYDQALRLLGKGRNILHRHRRFQWRYHQFNGLLEWPRAVRASYSLLTAIGCLGLSGDARAYQRAFAMLSSYLQPEGIFFGADWVRSADFIAKEGHDNRYLCCQLSKACAQANGLTIHALNRVPITGDPCYDHLIYWAFQKTKN